LTCFAHESYKIHTKNLVCEGNGGQYEVKPATGYLNGCLLEIHLEANSKYNDRIDVRAKLEEFLGRCQLPCKVFINDVQFTQWLYRRQVARELTFGNVHVNKSEKSTTNTLLVRVNGVLMYTKYSRANAQVVLEINQAKSREILLSNRDSLHSDYERELDEFLAEIAVDTKSALDSRRKKWKQRFGSSFYVKKNKPVVQAPAPVSYVVNTETAAAFVSTPAAASGNVGTAPTIQEIKQEIQKAIENMMISLDSDNAKIIRAAKSFQQENWVEGGGKKKKLLAIWTAACSAALDAYTELHSDATVCWLPGFLFSDETRAQCDSENGTHSLLVNPVDSDGKFAFKISKLEDRVRLISMAIHEVAHIKYSYHDEDFAGECTELTSKVFAKLPSILRAMRAVI
jgi:hypothetical protein